MQEGVHVVEDVILGHLRPISGLVAAQRGIGDVVHPAVTAQHLTLLSNGGAGLLRILATGEVQHARIGHMTTAHRFPRPAREELATLGAIEIEVGDMLT